MALVVLGELDVTAMEQFEQALAEVMAQNPESLVFDLTESQFIAAQLYDAIGQWSLDVSVEVRSRTAMASTVLGIYGHDRVVVVEA